MANYSICKCIRNDKPLKRNGKYPIYLQIRVGDRSTKIPTGLEVWDGRWDAKRMEPKDKTLAIQLNRKIMELDLYINRLLADGTELSMDLIKEFYDVKRAGIDKHVTYHSSRHTFATLLVLDKVDIYTISKYLGHKSVNMTQRYLKYDISIAKESAKNIKTFSGRKG